MIFVNSRAFSAFHKTLTDFNLNFETIRYAWYKLKLISSWESSGKVYPNIYYPDMKDN